MSRPPGLGRWLQLTAFEAHGLPAAFSADETAELVHLEADVDSMFNDTGTALMVGGRAVMRLVIGESAAASNGVLRELQARWPHPPSFLPDARDAWSSELLTATVPDPTIDWSAAERLARQKLTEIEGRLAEIGASPDEVEGRLVVGAIPAAARAFALGMQLYSRLLLADLGAG